MATPKLRFKGFLDPWQLTKIGDFTSSYSGGTPSAGNKSYYNGNIPFIRSAEINSSTTKLHINKDALANSSAKMVNSGMILYALYGATSGQVAISKIKGAINQAVLAMDCNGDADNGFLCQLLNFNKNRIVNDFIQGGQGNLSASIVKNLKFEMPRLEEQGKINALLSGVDELIKLQNDKLNTLKRAKNGYLQRMFKNLSESKQRLRFKGFTDDWQRVKLANIVNKFDSDRVPVSAGERVSGYVPYYGANGIQDHVQGYTHDGQYVLIAEDGANNVANYPVQYVNGKVWVNNHAHVLAGKPNVCDTLFLLYLLKSINFYPYLVGSGRYKLNAEAMLSINLKIPSLAEQKKIGVFMASVDNSIKLQGDKLERLKELKKGYLQHLFA